MHYVGTFRDEALAAHPTYEGHSRGYTQAALVDHTSGSVHTGLSIGELTPGGTLSPHVHSYEESFYLLSGQAVVAINDETYTVTTGDYAAIKVGTLHAWRNTGATPVRWLQMGAPQPKPLDQERDTFFKKGGESPTTGEALDVGNLRGNLLGHFDVSQLPPGEEGRMVSGGLKGVFLKWLID